jgi:HK97 family phage portal protein
VLHDLPNPELTAMELFETVTGHLALWGNAFCEIEYDGAGRRRALWPLRPDQMTVGVNERNERVYVYSLPSGEQRGLERWRVWHVRGWGTDAFVGKSPIGAARESVGLALATERYGATFFGNGSRPGGILKHPGKLRDASKLKESWESAFGGLSNAQRVAVLEEGVEWQAVGVPPEEAQFLETRAYQDAQICALYRVPPHMVGMTDRSTSWGTGIEQQSIGFVTHTLGPYLTRISQSAHRDLLTPGERRELFAEHLTAALLRGDLGSRYNAYSIGRTGGWLSVNDIRDMENMNPVADGDGYLQPLNMAPLGSEPNDPEKPDSSDGGEDDDEATD